MYTTSTYATPPAGVNIYMSTTNGCCYDSDTISHHSHDSPESLLTTTTTTTTPPRTPPSRSYGPPLLPRLRQQDRVTEPTAGVGPIRHRKRSISSTPSFQSSVFPYTLQRPVINGRCISPATPPNSTLSLAVSACHSGMNTAGTSPPISFNHLAQLNHSRSSSLAPLQAVPLTSAAPVLGHSRTDSGFSLNDFKLGQYGYQTYRNAPSYMPTAAYPATSTVSPVPEASIVPTMPAISDEFTFLNYDFEPTAPVPEYPLSMSTTSQTLLGSTNILTYLTTANPTPALVRRVNAGKRLATPHFWFDIRNLRQWRDFSLSAITSIPDLNRLIQTPTAFSNLPNPTRCASLAPESEAQLLDLYTEHFAAKLNAALSISQGFGNHMVMKSTRNANPSRSQPDFVSSYPTDADRIFQGERRGRVVGLIKAYEEWNSGMRAESAPRKVEYLRGLAHLQRVMREHGCRYGFIITEIELLCVRAGGIGSGEATSAVFDAATPLFGYLETAAAIQLSASASSDSAGGEMQWTAALALWYLHMLAKDEPLPGVGTWRMEVGGPIARTRANAIDKDAWIPKPSVLEKREAKRCRGWIWPEDPYHRKESCGKKRGKV